MDYEDLVRVAYRHGNLRNWRENEPKTFAIAVQRNIIELICNDIGWPVTIATTRNYRKIGVKPLALAMGI